MTAVPLPRRDRMAGRYFSQCPSCRTGRTLGPCCGGGGPVDPKTRRKAENAAVRRHVDDVLGGSAWRNDWDNETPDDAPELCEYCGHNPALYDTQEGFLCGWCDRRLNPREADDD